MIVTIWISAVQAAKAAATIANLAISAPLFPGGGSATGQFAAATSDEDGWLFPTEGDILRGICQTLTGDEPFGWTTSAGNRVTIAADAVAGFLVTFNTRRHALGDTGNGVGQVFEALGGKAWARQALPILYESSVPNLPWWETNGGQK